MLAQTVKLNVFHQHHLVVTHGEHRAVQELFRILMVATCQEAKGLFKSLGRVPQAVAGWVLSNQGDARLKAGATLAKSEAANGHRKTGFESPSTEE